MERLLVLQQSVDDYLILIARMTSLNENHIESLIIIILDSYLLVIIINRLSMNHFEVFNRKNRFFVRRLPLEADAPFHFQVRVQGADRSFSVWEVMTAKGVGPLLVFYDGRLDGSTYINMIKNHLLLYI